MKSPVKISKPAAQFAGAAAAGAVVGTVGTYIAVTQAFKLPKALHRFNPRKAQLTSVDNVEDPAAA